MPLDDDEAREPDEASLATALGKTKAHWDAILGHAERAGVTREWKNYGRKYGWQLKVSYKKRALVYLIPQSGSFRAALALSEAAVGALREAQLPLALVQEIEASKVSPEGRPARVEVKSKKDADVVMRLLTIKLATPR